LGTLVWPSSWGRFPCLVLLLLLCLFASSSCLFGMWLYVVYNIMFALEWFHDFIPRYEKWSIWRKGICAYLCVWVADVLVCGRLDCELFLVVCGSCSSSYNWFGSLIYCSVMSRFCIWMYKFYQWFIFSFFLHGYINFRVSFAVPYSRELHFHTNNNLW
jgi:hypothetical protein